MVLIFSCFEMQTVKAEPGPRNLWDFLKHSDTMQQQERELYLQPRVLSLTTPPSLILSLMM